MYLQLQGTKGNILNGNVAAFYINNNNFRLQSPIFISDRNTFSKTALQDIFEAHKPDVIPEISLQRSSFLDRKVQPATLIYNYLSDHVFKQKIYTVSIPENEPIQTY